MLCSKIEIEDSEGTVVKMEDEGYSALGCRQPCDITFPKIKEEVKWDPDELAELALMVPGVADCIAKLGLPSGHPVGHRSPKPEDDDVVDLTREESGHRSPLVDHLHKPVITLRTAGARNEAASASLSPSKNLKRKALRLAEIDDCFVVESKSSSKQTMPESCRKGKCPETCRNGARVKCRGSGNVNNIGQERNSSEGQVCCCGSDKETCSLHPGKGKYFCSLCGALFLWKHYLDKHMVSHAEEMPHSCPVCPAKFRLHESLEKHMRFHPEVEARVAGSVGQATTKTRHLGAVLGCAVCNLRFVLQEQLHNHLLAHPDRKLFFCAVCQSRFPAEDELISHVAAHSKGRRESVSCPSCAKEFAGEKLLEIHMMVSHKGNDQCLHSPGSSPMSGAPPSSSHSKKIVCTYHSSISESDWKPPVEYNRSLRIHTTQGVVVYNSFFPQHHKKNQDLTVRVSPNEKSDSVEKKVENKNDADPRKEVKLQKKKFHCRRCNAKFSLKDNLENHVAVHHPAKHL